MRRPARFVTRGALTDCETGLATETHHGDKKTVMVPLQAERLRAVRGACTIFTDWDPLVPTRPVDPQHADEGQAVELDPKLRGRRVHVRGDEWAFEWQSAMRIEEL